MAFDILVKQNATVDDTLQLIVNAINVCSKSPFVKQIVQEISKLHSPVTDKPGFIKALFDWACRNGKYQLDIPGIEEVWTPELTTREQRFDCKKITVLISSVLEAAGIPPIAKHVYYAGPDGQLENFTHIYTIVPASSLRGPGASTADFVLQPYITVDPTNNCEYNKEVASTKQTLYFLNGKKMELHMMGKAPARRGAINTSSFTSGVNTTACRIEDDMRSIVCRNPEAQAQTISGSNKYFSFTTAEAIAHAAKIGPYAIPRNAFLGLLYLGKLLAKTPLRLRLTDHIAKSWNRDPNKFRKMWWKLGGEADASAVRTALQKVIGGSIAGPSLEYMVTSNYDRPWKIVRPGVNGSIGEPLTLATASAALVAAAPIIAVVKKFLTDSGVIKDGQVDPAPTETVPVVIPDDGVDPGTNPNPSAGSFATHSIDNFHDLLNFVKASGVILLGASLNPSTVIPANIIVVVGFIYAIRKKIFFK